MFSVEKLPLVLMGLVVLILSVTVHEFSHALAATRLGDDLPEREGRLTLSPLAHIDPIGTILFPIIGGLTGIALIGWGRPVMTIPTNYTRKVTLRGGLALVSFAGPLSNLLMAIAALALRVVLWRFEVLGAGSPFILLLGMLASANIGLFIFNMIPMPPADGSKIASWIFGQKADGALDALSSLGPLGLYAVMILGGGLIGRASQMLFYLIDQGLRSIVLG